MLQNVLSSSQKSSHIALRMLCYFVMSPMTDFPTSSRGRVTPYLLAPRPTGEGLSVKPWIDVGDLSRVESRTQISHPI
jgi:hypothetical protein